jgi:2-polyprenyl-3-methyl-5-hydroxy-6-metoxy-1,4-benzoquinol methylase
MKSRPTKSRAQRWHEEASFFDDWARKETPSTIHPATLARYDARAARRWLNKEARFRTLGDLHGKQVLDLGCGAGANSALLAKLGARVVGIDISPEAIEVAWRRCRANGVDARVELVCAPIETASLDPDSFDVVWGDGILHHLIDELDVVMRAVARWTRPGGTMLFAEPVNLFPPLRRLRMMLPVAVHGTPNERPLEAAELERVCSYYARADVRHFQMVGRLERLLLPDHNYERSPAWRRRLVDGVSLLDYGLLSLPGVRTLGSTVVISGPPAKAITQGARRP